MRGVLCEWVALTSVLLGGLALPRVLRWARAVLVDAWVYLSCTCGPATPRACAHILDDCGQKLPEWYFSKGLRCGRTRVHFRGRAVRVAAPTHHCTDWEERPP